MRGSRRVAVADNNIRASKKDGLDKPGNIGASVLIVAVSIDNDIGPESQRDVQSSPEGRGKAPISRVTGNVVGSGVQGNRAGSILRTVVDNHHQNLVDPWNSTRNLGDDIG